MPASPHFYFGVMSPYSWFTAERIGRLLPEAQWCGLFLGAVFKANDRTSWGLTDERDAGIADCEQRAAGYGLGPIRWPDPWPTIDLAMSRAMVFVADSSQAAGDSPKGQDALRAFALAAMRLAFLEGADLEQLDSVLEAGRRVGIDEQALRDAVTSQSVKDELRRVNAEAVELGVFGAPTLLFDGELFWGDDRLDDAVAAYRRAERS